MGQIRNNLRKKFIGTIVFKLFIYNMYSVLYWLFLYKYVAYILSRTLADQVDEDQYKDFYYQHHGGAVSYGHQGRGQGSQQYYMTIDQVL